MNANRYMRDSLRTADRSNMDRLKLECALGLCGEAGEVAEQVKKHFFHGHELDKRHMIEELGDVAWYLAVLCDAIGSDLDTVMEENLKKLEQRYPELKNGTEKKGGKPMPKPWENAEGYHDPTAYHGTKNIIRDEDEQQKRVNTLIFVLKYITRLAGFELLNRIEIKDRKTGREYK